MHRSSTAYKQNKSLANMLVDFDVRGHQGMNFFTEGRISMDYGLIF